jgi:hypothetical protein
MSQARSSNCRRPVIEEIEPRILYAADFAPHALDHDTGHAAEQRTLDDNREFDGAPDAHGAGDDRHAREGRGEWEFDSVLAHADSDRTSDSDDDDGPRRTVQPSARASATRGLTGPHALASADGPNNDAPQNNVPASRTTTMNRQMVFLPGQISIADVDAGSAQIEIRITVANGTLRLGGIPRLTMLAGDWRGDTSMAIRGTVADINGALNNCSFRPDAGFVGTASVTIHTDDLGNSGPGGALTDTDTIWIEVVAPGGVPPASPPQITSTPPAADSQPSIGAAGGAAAPGVSQSTTRSDTFAAPGSAVRAGTAIAASSAVATAANMDSAFAAPAGSDQAALDASASVMLDGVVGSAPVADHAASVRVAHAASAPHGSAQLLRAEHTSRTDTGHSAAPAAVLAGLWRDLDAPLLAPVAGLMTAAHASESDAAQAQRDGVAALARDLTYTMGFAVSVGAVLWANRAGLLASALLSMPAWRGIDPLPVVSNTPTPATDATARAGNPAPHSGSLPARDA